MKFDRNRRLGVIYGVSALLEKTTILPRANWNAILGGRIASCSGQLRLAHALQAILAYVSQSEEGDVTMSSASRTRLQSAPW